MNLSVANSVYIISKNAAGVAGTLPSLCNYLGFCCDACLYLFFIFNLIVHIIENPCFYIWDLILFYMLHFMDFLV